MGTPHPWRDLWTILKAHARTWKYRLGRLLGLIPRPRPKYYHVVNRPLDDDSYRELLNNLYGNQYIREKYLYAEAPEYPLNLKRWYAQLIKDFLPGVRTICDAGCNRGYLIKALVEAGYDAYGFDVLEDDSLVLPDIRHRFRRGSILAVPDFGTTFDLVTSIDVFEHIPINHVPRMAAELVRLAPKYFLFQISADVFGDGHITIRPTRWWLAHFARHYRLMTELTPRLRKVRLPDGHLYEATGTPRNRFNAVPGICFLVRKENSL